MRYFGTKASTSGYVMDIVNALNDSDTIADAFGGLGTIGAELKCSGRQVTTCDVLTFPHFFQVAKIECNEIPEFSLLKAKYGFNEENDISMYLSNQVSSRSWIVDEYARKRKFFTEENAIKIAGAWEAISGWNEQGLLAYRERAFLLASLIDMMDKVANTAGTYYAYLKEYDRKALRPFVFKWIEIKSGKHLGKALLGDAHQQLEGKEFDVLYLDPPYNTRNYSGYYHLPETLAGLKRKKIKESTLSGVPQETHPFSSNIRDAMSMNYIEKIIEDINWNHLIFHYCDNALIPLDLIRERLKTFGTLKEHIIPALGYTTDKKSRNITHNVFVVSSA